jgi:hypothetical protein
VTTSSVSFVAMSSKYGYIMSGTLIFLSVVGVSTSKSLRNDSAIVPVPLVFRDSNVGQIPHVHNSRNIGKIPVIPNNLKIRQVPPVHSKSKLRQVPPVHRNHTNSRDTAEMSQPRKSLPVVANPMSVLNNLMNHGPKRRSVGARSSLSQNILRRLLQQTDELVEASTTTSVVVPNDSIVQPPDAIDGIDEIVVFARSGNSDVVFDVHMEKLLPKNKTTNRTVRPPIDEWRSDTNIPVRTDPIDTGFWTDIDDDDEYGGNPDEVDDMDYSVNRYYDNYPLDTVPDDSI